VSREHTVGVLATIKFTTLPEDRIKSDTSGQVEHTTAME